MRHTPHPLNLELPPGKKFLVDESCVQRWRATMTEAEDLGLQEILERKNEVALQPGFSHETLDTFPLLT